MKTKLLRIQNYPTIHDTTTRRTNIVPKCIASVKWVGEVFDGNQSQVTCPYCLEKMELEKKV